MKQVFPAAPCQMKGSGVPSPQEVFPVREDFSDISEEDASSKPPQPAQPVIHSFKMKKDSDLFGLGLDELGPSESSEEGRSRCRALPQPVGFRFPETLLAA